MHKQDLEASLAGLSRDDIAKILSDLAAADPAIEKRIMTAVESPQVCLKSSPECETQVLIRSISLLSILLQVKTQPPGTHSSIASKVLDGRAGRRQPQQAPHQNQSIRLVMCKYATIATDCSGSRCSTKNASPAGAIQVRLSCTCQNQDQATAMRDTP